MNIGFIGVGVMGGSMVRNLMKKGFQVQIYSRTKEKVLPLIEEGAIWCEDIKSCAAKQDAVITMVGFPKDVEDVYFRPDGILNAAKKGAYLIDMTTTDPKLSERIYDSAKEKGMYALDAPVSGGDVGAKNATLSIMAGGDKEAFDACMEIWKALGSTINYEGGAGTGQHTKMCNQIALSGVIAGVCESLIYAEKNGLDPKTMLSSISSGAAGSWQMTNMAPRILNDDYDPGFFIKHYIKDMKIASDCAADKGLHLNILSEVLSMYQSLEKEGLGELGTQALIKYYLGQAGNGASVED